MNITVVDLVTINNVAKAMKQKTVIIYNNCLYGLDNIDGCLIYSNMNDMLHDKYNNFNGIVIDTKELSAFIKSIGSETEFELNFVNNICRLVTLFDGLLVLTKQLYLLPMINEKINRVVSNNIVTPKDITNEISDLFSMKKADGVYYYRPVVNNIKYFITLFSGLLPLNKSDKVFMSIDDNIYNNFFITHFIIKKKKIEVNIYLCYLRI